LQAGTVDIEELSAWLASLTVYDTGEYLVFVTKVV